LGFGGGLVPPSFFLTEGKKNSMMVTGFTENVYKTFFFCTQLFHKL